MLRRRPAAEPTSKTAIWARRVALFAVAIMLLAILIARGGFFDIGPTLATIGAALIMAVIGIVLSFAAGIIIWRSGNPGIGIALTAFVIGVALLAYPSYLGLRAYQLPQITDVTTDPLDPPRFEAIARLRPRDANPAAYAGLTAAELQRVAYPEIEPLVVGSTPQQSFDAAMNVINKLKWRVVDARPPQANRREGRIEAVARTLIFGFRDDVVVRIRPVPDGTRIDFRSASRYGRSDFGTNAARIRGLSEAIDETLGEEEKPRPQQRQAKGVQPPAKGAQPAKR